MCASIFSCFNYYLTKRTFLQDCLKPLWGKKIFFCVLTLGGGQAKPEIYDEIFNNDYNLPTCTIKVIPPKCMPLVLPCDVYFYRQAKILIKSLQNCSYLIENKQQISS